MKDAFGRPFRDLQADATVLSDKIKSHFTVPVMVETILAGYRAAIAERRA